MLVLMVRNVTCRTTEQPNRGIYVIVVRHCVVAERLIPRSTGNRIPIETGARPKQIKAA
jgi:hypothetical protein